MAKNQNKPITTGDSSTIMSHHGNNSKVICCAGPAWQPPKRRKTYKCDLMVQVHRLHCAHYSEARLRIFCQFLKTSLLDEPSVIEYDNLVRIF
jgi:hypothetical protein